MNLKKYSSPHGNDKSEIVTFDTSDYDGFDDLSKNYLFVSRSFSIIDTQNMTMISDSGCDFEEITS